MIEKDEVQLSKPIPVWVLILRWIGILPSCIAIYILAQIINDWITSRYLPELVHDLFRAPDFAGHVILGPVYVFQRFAIAVALAVYAGIRIAPSHRKIVFFCIIGLWFLFLIFGAIGLGVSFHREIWTTGKIIRLIVETLAQGIGLVFGGLVALKYVKFD